MGINLPIILYTHTDMEDVWPMTFGQMKKYLSDFKVYVAVNETRESIPSEYETILYDDTVTYTERWQQILPQIKEDIILFLHEDMVVLDVPDIALLETYVRLLSEGKAHSIKLIFAGDNPAPSYIHPTLVSNALSKVSVQPTIIKKDSFNTILNNIGPKNIWDFESAISLRIGDFMAYIGTETKRGMFHYDSKVFPYIATAINKGKWNYSEYKFELDMLSTEYSIDLHERGMV